MAWSVDLSPEGANGISVVLVGAIFDRRLVCYACMEMRLSLTADLSVQFRLQRPGVVRVDLPFTISGCSPTLTFRSTAILYANSFNILYALRC